MLALAAAGCASEGFLPDTNHNDGGILGNFAGGSVSESKDSILACETIDQVLAYSSKFYPTPPRHGDRGRAVQPFARDPTPGVRIVSVRYETEAGKGYGETRTLGKPADAFAVDYDIDRIGDGLPGIKA